MKVRLFLLSLLLLAAALPVMAQDAAIELGETVEGELDQDNPAQRFTFEGEAGQSILITLSSPDFDTYLVIEDEDGTELAFNDDGVPGTLNSRIGPYELPESGEYTIVADSYRHHYNASEVIAGAFTLSLAEVNARRIEYTQRVTGELGSQQRQVFYTFRGQEGDPINLIMSSDDFPGTITLSVDGQVLNSADASYSGGDVAAITGYSLPSTGNYLVTVSTNSSASGAFELLLDRVDVTNVGYGDTIEATLNSENRILLFTFEAEAGDVVNLLVESDGSIDTTMTLNGPDSYQLMYVDDSNELDPAIENMLLPQSGTYTVLVQPYSVDSRTEGEIAFSITRGELLSLDAGSQTLRFSSDHTREMLSFSAEAGDQVRLVVEVMKGGPASPSIVVMQGQQSVSYISGTSLWGMSSEFQIPADGELIVQVDESSYTELSLDIRIERVEADDAGAEEEATEES